MKDDLENILIDGNEGNGESKDSDFYENEIKEFMLIHEGEQISNDIQLLRDMGYDNKMINKVYILLHPETIDRAIDYMTEIDGIIQHDFFENHYKLKDRNLCFICGKTKRYHLDYIPEEFLEDNNFDFNFNDDDNNCIETHIWLFDNGDTALRVIDAPLGVIDDCIVDFYVKVRQEWKNSV